MNHLSFKQAEANNKQEQAVVPWKELQHAGIPTDFARFSAEWEKESNGGPLHNVVDRFDSQGIVVKTLSKDQPAQGNLKAQSGQLEKMAKRATQKAMR